MTETPTKDKLTGSDAARPISEIEIISSLYSAKSKPPATNNFKRNPPHWTNVDFGSGTGGSGAGWSSDCVFFVSKILFTSTLAQRSRDIAAINGQHRTGGFFRKRQIDKGLGHVIGCHFTA